METSKIATKVAELDTDSESDPKIRFLASAWTGLFVLVKAVIEKTLDPLVTGQGGAALKASRPPPPPPPKPIDASRALREAMNMSDKQSVMFDANLGPNAIANRNVLSDTFSLTIKNQTLKIA